MEISKKDRSYFRLAANISEQSDHKYKLGCVIVNNHHVISTGHNSATITHGMQARLDKKFFNTESAGCRHAEIDALLPLIHQKIDLTRATLYVFRRNKLNQLAIARPCPRCMSIIKSCGIKRIKYTTQDGYAFELLEKNF